MKKKKKKRSKNETSGGEGRPKINVRQNRRCLNIWQSMRWWYTIRTWDTVDKKQKRSTIIKSRCTLRQQATQAAQRSIVQIFVNNRFIWTRVHWDAETGQEYSAQWLCRSVFETQLPVLSDETCHIVCSKKYIFHWENLVKMKNTEELIEAVWYQTGFCDTNNSDYMQSKLKNVTWDNITKKLNLKDGMYFCHVYYKLCSFYILYIIWKKKFNFNFFQKNSRITCFAQS